MHRPVGHAAAHLGREHLAARGLGGHIAAFVALARGVDHHALGRVQLGLAVGQHGLHQLELGDRLAKLLAVDGVTQRVVQDALGHAHAHGGQVDAAFFKHLHRGLEALAFFVTDQVDGGHTHVVKHHVAGVCAFLAHLLVVLAQADAGRLGVDDEGRHAARTLVGRVGARHEREDFGMRRVGDVTLGAVDDVVVALTVGASDGRGAQRCGVGARIGFGQRKRRRQLARGQLGQVIGFLCFGAIHQNALRANAHRGADHRAECRRGLAQLKQEARLLFHGQLQAAIGLGDGQTEQAHLAHLLHDGFGDLVGFGDFVLGRDQTLAHKTAHGVEQGFKGFGISDHGEVVLSLQGICGAKYSRGLARQRAAVAVRDSSLRSSNLALAAFAT